MLYAVRHWLLTRRGWDADAALYALDRRLDAPTLIDLIGRARPGGERASDERDME